MKHINTTSMVFSTTSTAVHIVNKKDRPSSYCSLLHELLKWYRRLQCGTKACCFNIEHQSNFVKFSSLNTFF